MQRERRNHVPVRRALVPLIVLTGAGVFLAGADPARAGLGTSSAPEFPTTVTVGATGLSASIELTNQNTWPDAAAPTTVCNFGDGAPCPVGEPGITITPSCGAVGAFSTCTTPDPGVFRLSPTAVGAPRTDCAGMTFTITEIDTATGRHRITPDGGAHVELPGNGGTCRINFTIDVLQMPALDQNPALAGIQTVQVSDHTVWASTLLASARGTSTGVTAVRNEPAIATSATSEVAIDVPFSDVATVTGLVRPVPGATVTFELFAPGDTTCSADPVHTSTVPLRLAANGTSGTATASPHRSATPGTYRWIATYDGDANNAPVSGECGDPTEQTVVTRNRPAIATVASASSEVGTGIDDVATVTGLLRPRADATVTFRLYGPDDATCATEPVSVSTTPLVLDASGTSGTATAATFVTSLPGVYRWIATYDGDANNAPVSGECGDPSETVMITRTPIPAGVLPETV